VSRPPDKENQKFIYEQVKARYEFEHQRSSDLDTKSSGLVGWIGLIISILLAGGATLFSRQGEEQFTLTGFDLIVLIVLLSILMVSLAFALMAYRISHYKLVPKPRHLADSYWNGSHDNTLWQITRALIRATEFNEKENNKKVFRVQTSWMLFLVGIVLAAIFIIMQSLKIVNG
jgi:uncharacterized membrane protein YoaK (UPF0700 family)